MPVSIDAASTRSGSSPILLSVEAIIGAGKSSLLEELDARSDVLVVREPVDLWEQQRGGDTLLSRYYQDQKANAFMFQTYAMMSHVKALRQAMARVTPDIRAVVMERSWLSARHCFAAHLQTLGCLDELESSLHKDLFDWGLESWPEIDGVVFIELPVAVAQTRVAKRGRTAESTIPSDYQGALSEKHQEWLHGEGVGRFRGPVLTLDGSKDKCDGALRTMADSVVDFVGKLQAAKQQKLSLKNDAKRNLTAVNGAKESADGAAGCIADLGTRPLDNRSSDVDLAAKVTPLKLDPRHPAEDGQTPLKRRCTA